MNRLAYPDRLQWECCDSTSTKQVWAARNHKWRYKWLYEIYADLTEDGFNWIFCAERRFTDAELDYLEIGKLQAVFDNLEDAQQQAELWNAQRSSDYDSEWMERFGPAQ